MLPTHAPSTGFFEEFAGADVQLAIDTAYAAGGGIVRLRNAVYRLRALTMRDGVSVIGSEGSVLDFSQKGFFANQDGMIVASGSTSNLVNVTSDVAEGAVAIPVDSIVGFSPGDQIMIRTTEREGAAGKIADILRVKWADSGFIYVQQPIDHTYTVSGFTVTVVKINTITFALKNLAIRGSGPNGGIPSPPFTGTPPTNQSQTQWGDIGVDIRYGRDCIIENVEMIDVEGLGIQLTACDGTVIRGCKILFDDIPIFPQYGVYIFTVNTNTRIEGCVFRNGRHHMSTGYTNSATQDYLYGSPNGIAIVGNQHFGSWLYPIDSHEAAINISITGNTLTGLCGGINARGRKMSIAGNVISLPRGAFTTPGILPQNGISISDGCRDITITGNEILGGQYGIFVSDPTSVGFRIIITDNAIGETSLSGIQVEDCNNVTISGNNVGPSTGATTARIRLTDCQFVSITSNTVACDVAATQIGIFLSATVSGDTSNCMIEGNIVEKIAGTITGISLDNETTNTVVGYNSLHSCDTQLNMGTDTSNTSPPVAGAGYAGLLTVASGAITVLDEWTSGIITTEGGGATDDLDTINGGFTGQFMTFRGNSALNVVTFKDAGNLRLAGDFVMTSSASTITLVKFSTVWYEVARSVN